MTSDPEEAVRLQGYGEMTLRTAIATLMALAPRERSATAIFRVRDGTRLSSREIRTLASDWSIAPTPRTGIDQHWPDIVRGIVREAPLPSLMLAFLLGALVARR